MSNQIIINGRLGADIELKKTQNAKSYCSFSVATTNSWKTNSGETKEETTWFNCIAWGWVAEYMGQHGRKGDQVYVDGSMKQRKYTDKQGIERTGYQVTAHTCIVGTTARKAPNAEQNEEPLPSPEDVDF